MPVILIDSVYSKDENYYPKVLLEKFVHNFFWRSLLFGALEVPPEISEVF